MPNVIMVTVIMLNVIMLNVVRLSANMMSGNKLSVVMPIAIWLRVVAPNGEPNRTHSLTLYSKW
jgi:hypothetical protein